MRIFLIFLILLFLFPTFIIISSSLPSTGNFIVYNETSVIFLNNGSTVIQRFIFLQQVDEAFPNGTGLIEFTYFYVNGSYYSTSYSIENLSAPPNFYYISPNLLGKNIPCRGLSFKYVKNDVYLYCSTHVVQGVTIIYKMWINGTTGVAEKVQTLQIGAGNRLVSNATATLWITNIGNQHATLPDLYKGYTQAKAFTVNINDTLCSIHHLVLESLVAILLTLVLIFLIFRR